MVPNEKSFLMPVIINVSGGCSMEDTEMVQHSRLKRRLTDSNDVDHDIDEDGETSQAQQSKKQKLVSIQLNIYYIPKVNRYFFHTNY